MEEEKRDLERPRPERESRKLPSLKQISIGVLAVLIVILIIQNTHTVSLHFLFMEIAMPGVVFYPLIFIIGFAAGWIARTLRKK